MRKRIARLPTIDYLRSALKYDPDTGRLQWRERPLSHFKNEDYCKRWNTRFSGKEITTMSAHGYIRFCIDYRFYLAHRVIYAMVTGEWPTDEIDHINHVKTDNRWANLRPVDRSAQMKNTSLGKNNTSGFNGVSWDKKSKRWIAMITVDRKQRSLGAFVDKMEAVAARKAAEVQGGFHTNHGT